MPRQSRRRTPEQIAELKDNINFHYWSNGKSISWIMKNLHTSMTMINKLLLSKQQYDANPFQRSFVMILEPRKPP